MSNTSTNFDKELDDILLRHGAEQGELHYSLKEAIKQAVSKHVIGEDLPAHELVDAPFYVNEVKRKQRQSLWGTRNV